MVELCLHLIQQVLALQNWLNIASGLLPYPRSCCPFSPGKNVFLPLRATYLPTLLLLLTESYWTSVYLYYSLYLEVFLNLFREHKVSSNQVFASKCSVVFCEETYFLSGRAQPGSCSKQNEAKKDNPFTSPSSHRTHGMHIPCCRLVWDQFYLPFILCNLNTWPFLVSSFSLAENYSLLSHRNMKNMLLSILRRETGLNFKIRMVCVALWAGCSRSTFRQ